MSKKDVLVLFSLGGLVLMLVSCASFWLSQNMSGWQDPARPKVISALFALWGICCLALVLALFVIDGVRGCLKLLSRWFRR